MSQLEFDMAISFGPTCRAKYQLDRVFGDGSASSVMAWQITPRRAQRAYLHHRFAGLFELHDLEVRDGIVVNRRFGTKHPHEFPAGIAAGQIAAQYNEARSRHDHLAAKTRDALNGDQRVLICLSDRFDARHMLRHWLTIRLLYPSARFRLLNAPHDPMPRQDEGWKGTDAIWDRHFDGMRIAAKVPSTGFVVETRAG